MKWMRDDKTAPGGVGGKLEKIRQQLQALAARKKDGGAEAAAQTITDDTPLPPDKVTAIARDEELVRGALAMFGIGYDDLIAMQSADGKPTAYAQAVQANPALLQQVKASSQPVIEALKIATGFKPYAEFADRYGQTPDAVKAAIRAELENEMKGSDTAEPTVKQALAPVFSANRAGAAKPAAKTKKGGLSDVFGK